MTRKTYKHRRAQVALTAKPSQFEYKPTSLTMTTTAEDYGDYENRHYTLLPPLPGAQRLTVAKVTFVVDDSRTFTTALIVGSRYSAVGTAKRNPRDKYNHRIGQDLALSRALHSLAAQLEQHAGS